MLSFFPRGVLDEILNLIESVSEEFPSYLLMFRTSATSRADGLGLVKHVKTPPPPPSNQLTVVVPQRYFLLCPLYMTISDIVT